MLKAFLEHRRVAKTLEQYVPPEVARQIADGTFDVSDREPAERTFEAVFVRIDARDATAYAERIGTLAQLASEHGGAIFTLLPVAVIGFDAILAAPSGSRSSFVAAVRIRIPDAAIVHGPVTAHVGSFGYSGYMQIGCWWPGALDAVRQLAAIDPGHVQEFIPNDRSA